MNKKLAIKGHPTRGKEVIELLEKLGGNNDQGYIGTNTWKDEYYFLDNGYIRAYDWCDGIKFTLEEFWEKYPFKIGDKVYTKSNAEGTIIDIFWDGIEVLYQLSSANVNALGYFHRNELKSYKEEVNMKDKEDKLFDSIIWHLRNSVNNGKQNISGGECEDYFREVVKKNNENKMKNVLAGLLEHIKTTPKEELEREFEEIKEWSNVGPTVEEFRTFCECVNKKPKYPETYKECCDALNLAWNKCFVMFDIDHNGLTDEENNLYESLIKLKRCRDAYWKIAGEKLELGKPWEPDWIELSPKYTITVIENKFEKRFALTQSYILAFPTEEMRDAFFENFNDLIEQCKELL